jgi:hypothetical protein
MALPTDIANLKLWLKADAGVFSDAGVTPAVNNDSVQQWNDQSGNGNNATQASGPSRPTYKTGIVNGKPVIRFAAGRINPGFMTIPDSAGLELDTDSTVFIVFAHDVNATTHTLLSKDNDGFPGAYSLFIGTDEKLELDRPFVEAGTNPGSALDSSFHVVTVRVSGTTVDYWLDGASDGSDPSLAVGTQTNTALQIGQFRNGQRFFSGDIAEIIIYNTALNTSDRKAVEDYLIRYSEGVSISKTVGYAVLHNPADASGVNVSKTVGYAVLSIPYGVDITKALAFAVLASVNPPAWPGTGFPNGSLNVSYSASLAVTGTTPITFSVVSGALPTGLTLSGSGTIATISGTPTVLGTFTFTLRASNTYGTADQSFSIVISSIDVGGSYGFLG